MNPPSLTVRPPHRCRYWPQAGEASACAAAHNQAVQHRSARPQHVVVTLSWAAKALGTTYLIRRELAAQLTDESGARLKSP